MVSAKEPNRRDFLSLTGRAMGAIALGAAGWAMIDSMNPAADASHSRMVIDLTKIKLGQRTVVAWQGIPVFVYHRTQEDIAEVRADDWRSLPDPQSDDVRVLKGHAEWLVVKGVCSYHGCVLMGNREGQPRGKWGGWFCPCCGANYDKSGRARSLPANKNLRILQYTFVDDEHIAILGVLPL